MPTGQACQGCAASRLCTATSDRKARRTASTNSVKPARRAAARHQAPPARSRRGSAAGRWAAARGGFRGAGQDSGHRAYSHLPARAWCGAPRRRRRPAGRSQPPSAQGPPGRWARRGSRTGRRPRWSSAGWPGWTGAPSAGCLRQGCWGLACGSRAAGAGGLEGRTRRAMHQAGQVRRQQQHSSTAACCPLHAPGSDSRPNASSFPADRPPPTAPMRGEPAPPSSLNARCTAARLVASATRPLRLSSAQLRGGEGAARGGWRGGGGPQETSARACPAPTKRKRAHVPI